MSSVFGTVGKYGFSITWSSRAGLRIQEGKFPRSFPGGLGNTQGENTLTASTSVFHTMVIFIVPSPQFRVAFEVYSSQTVIAHHFQTITWVTA